MNNVAWTEQELEILQNQYPLIGPKEISSLLPNRTNACIKQKASDLRIKYRLCPFTNEQIRLIKTHYPIDGTQTLINLIPLKTKEEIGDMAYRLGIKFRNFTKDESFFEIPNITNCSVAGILASDGHIKADKIDSNTGNFTYSISFYQITKDKEILEQICKVTKSNYQIKDRFRSKQRTILGRDVKTINSQSTLTIYNAKKWADDLFKNWGIPVGSKSNTMPAPPIEMDLDCKLAYLAGLISGDGSIVNNGGYLRIDVLGTQPLLEWCRNTICQFLGKDIKAQVYKEHKKRPNKCLYQLCINSYMAILLFDKIQSLNCVKLTRKWNNPIILDLINKQKNSPKFLALAMKKFDSLPDYIKT